MFTFVGLKFLVRYAENFNLNLSVEGHRDNSVYLLCAGYQWNKRRMDLYEPVQLKPDKMKVNYSTGRLGATTRRAGKGYIEMVTFSDLNRGCKRGLQIVHVQLTPRGS